MDLQDQQCIAGVFQTDAHIAVVHGQGADDAAVEI